MATFDYADGAMRAEGVPLSAIAERIGTPFYCYSSAGIAANYRAFEAVLPQGALIAYAVKANPSGAVLRTLARIGAGADIVSAGELARNLAAGIPPSRTVFSGVGKTAEEMRAALAVGVHQFNVESEPELDSLDDVARGMGKRAPVAIRVNPNIDAGTHAKITTGTAEAKFGVPLPCAAELFARAARMANIGLLGLHVHLGSQITELAPFEAAYRQAVALLLSLRSQGHALSRLDLGGGIGVPYRAGERAFDLAAYGAMVERLTRDVRVELLVEPGRLLVADAGVLVSRVTYVKPTPDATFVILDAGMNDLVRPAMYDGHHEIRPVTEAAPGAPRAVYEVVGPICESSDTFARGRELPVLKAGDLVAIMTTGAYGASMASTYNSRPPAAEVMVSGDEWAVVKPRGSNEELFASERMPDWLT